MKTKRKLIAVLTLAGFSLTGLGIPLASAEGGTSSTVNPKEEVSFSLTKYKGEVGDKSSPLEGVSFKIEKVTTTNPLTTNRGWEEVASLEAGTACEQRSCSEIKTITTDASGQATISTQDTPTFTVGVYKVTEQSKAGYTAAAPFLITLPYTKDGTWNYNLSAFPKNQVLNPTKSVKDTGEKIDQTGTDLGQTITYTIDVPVPADPVGTFKVEDSLPAGLKPTAVTVTSDPDAGLVQTTDYTQTISGQTVTVQITDAGQKKLKALRNSNPALKLVLELSALVEAFPASGYQFANQAEVTYPHRDTPIKTSSDQDFDPTSAEEPSPTLTKYVDVQITKHGQTAKESADLSGAEFEIYVCEEKTAGVYETKGSALKGAASANDTKQVTTFTTKDPDKNAKTATVTAFKLQDPRYRNGAVLAQAVTYCALETKAPAGFVRDPNPRKIEFAANATTGTVEVTDQEETILSNLPLTGAAGIYTLLTVGGFLVIIGFLMNSRRSNKEGAGIIA